MGNLLKSTGFADAFRTPAVANRSIRFILFAIIINIIIIIVGCSRSTTAQLSRLGEGLFGSRQKNRLFVSFLLLLLLFFLAGYGGVVVLLLFFFFVFFFFVPAESRPICRGHAFGRRSPMTPRSTKTSSIPSICVAVHFTKTKK